MEKNHQRLHNIDVYVCNKYQCCFLVPQLSLHMNKALGVYFPIRNLRQKVNRF